MSNHASNKLIYACPVCKQELSLNANSLQCPNGHNYDIAREGYVNLLLANQKRSQEPGDNKKMVANRRRFFSKGFYDPVSDKVNALILDYATHKNKDARFNVLDCGCGEGYFLHNLRDAFAGTEINYLLCGIDISKFAIKAAAKQDKATNWAVASIYDLPVLTDSVDYILNIMAPQSSDELARVLRPKGNLLVINPGPMHLFSLRQHIYTHPEEHKEANQSIIGFDFVNSHRVSYTCEMGNADIMDLFVMTPYSWNASQSAREKIMTLEHLTMEIDFVVTIFEKAPSVSQ